MFSGLYGHIDILTYIVVKVVSIGMVSDVDVGSAEIHCRLWQHFSFILFLAFSLAICSIYNFMSSISGR